MNQTRGGRFIGNNRKSSKKITISPTHLVTNMWIPLEG